MSRIWSDGSHSHNACVLVEPVWWSERSYGFAWYFQVVFFYVCLASDKHNNLFFFTLTKIRIRSVLGFFLLSIGNCLQNETHFVWGSLVEEITCSYLDVCVCVACNGRFCRKFVLLLRMIDTLMFMSDEKRNDRHYMPAAHNCEKWIVVCHSCT